MVSDFLKGHPAVRAQLQALRPSEVAVSTVSIMEIEFGLEKNPAARTKYADLWNDFLQDVTVLEYDRASAAQTARIRQALNSKGQPIGPYDLQLAGAALAHRLTLVTNNTAEFSRVEGLNLTDWR